MSEGERFVDILLPRRTESGIFSYMTRSWNPQRTLILDKIYSPQDLKDAVAKSIYMDSIIEAESTNMGVSKESLRKEMLKYLEEMGLEKKMYVIRWMGVVFLKISFMMKIGVFVNEPAVLRVRSCMGNNPVLFLPTHRSYADFCLLTYLCYHYDIDFPAVAAGMDFYSMAIVGRRMRETCAFYIRRTLVGAPLYAATLRQYVRTLMSKHCAPVEFFIEGTRSRSNKSLPPKYGMLSMALVPVFAGDVSDITIVPINISYDRLMEHGLFAYEHLGVPKPKETTGGLLKALHSLNDHFGNIYINMGSPISVKQYIRDHKPRPNEMNKPSDLQQLTPEQFAQVQDIADHVVQKQQECTVATITNLICLVLMQSLMKNEVLSQEDVIEEIGWVIEVLKKLGASVYEVDVERSVARILVVHSKMMMLDKKKNLRLITSSPMNVTSDVKKKMKGHVLKSDTMVSAVPVIQLQLYVNPILHYIAPSAIISLIVTRRPLTKDMLKEDYYKIRKLLKYEFFHCDKYEETTFDSAFQYCVDNDVVVDQSGVYCHGRHDRLRYLLKWPVWPALATLNMTMEVMKQKKTCDHKTSLKLIQERVEMSNCHPYCLSLEAIANCLNGLVIAGALDKNKTNSTSTVYEVVPDKIEQCINLVSSVLPTINIDFGVTNEVVIDTRIPSRL